MEIEVIRKLIEVDKENRNRMETMHEQKFRLRQAIEDEKVKLSEMMWQDAQKKVDATKAELDREISMKEEKTEQFLQKEMDRLRKTFQLNQEHWVKELTNRIIGSQTNEIE